MQELIVGLPETDTPANTSKHTVRYKPRENLCQGKSHNLQSAPAGVVRHHSIKL